MIALERIQDGGFAEAEAVLDGDAESLILHRDGAAHGASFELVHGECVAGPCRGASLRAIPIEVRDGAVLLAHMT
ncbi:MAG: hypothetical protein LC715_02545 [Gammaproteobacteria bacterium]|nr:hypothetical protein [Gammaproteobacteria bacterium]